MRWLLAPLVAVSAAMPAQARDVAASAPVDVSVTIYRAPYRNGGSIQLSNLGGFAVVSETRRVAIPAGRHRLRFGGVVDGIIPASAIVSGIPGGVLEKNQDAELLNPSALMRAARGKQITLTRTDPTTGKRSTAVAEIVSASSDGVVFRTADGTESLRCSGLPETFRYGLDASGLNAQPTLSVVTNAPRAITTTITLTYIAEGFDWSANYTAHLNPDGKTLELGGWITLANGNSVSLANARTQIVAGGLNRAYVARYINNQPQVLARCWEMQTTSDIPLKPDRPYELVRPFLEPGYRRFRGEKGLNDIIVTGTQSKRVNFDSPVPVSVFSSEALAPPPPEQLGDLKLYRMPQRTTVAAMQMKQTRLVDQSAVPYEAYFTATIPAFAYGGASGMWPVYGMIRMLNTKAEGLGLPLPAGQFMIGQTQFGRAMLVGQPSLSDTAEGEKLELLLGNAPDLNVKRVTISHAARNQEVEVTITNAGLKAASFELQLAGDPSEKIDASPYQVVQRDGKRLIVFSVPGEGKVTVRYTVRTP
jgi:hypothetical protein